MLYKCPSLDSALDYITTANNINFRFAQICLPSGYFALRKSWSLPNISFILTGHKGDDLYPSIIQCDYSDKQDADIVFTASALQYTLLFQNVQFVKFEYVQFKSCPQPLRIEQSYKISILNCVFTNFSEGVLDIYASAHINITSSNFSDNRGTGNVLLPFRGNTGAVAISYFQNLQTNSTILIENCIFINNQATISTKSSLASTNNVLKGIYIGRGGAFDLLVYESSYNVTAVIANCEFVNSFASEFGGAAYVIFSGESTQHVIIMENCQFINNTATLGAGGISFGLFSNALRSFPSTAVVRNCYYSGNQGRHGGAINIIPSQAEGNVVAIENSTFENNEASNFGGAIVVATQTLFESTEQFLKYNISNW